MSADPTRIELNPDDLLDPRIARMRGTTYHRGIYFDVPFVSEVAENLWMGGCTDGLILPDEIRNLVSLYPWERYTVHHELQSVLTVRMYDSLDQGLAQVDGIARWVNASREQYVTLVHCQAGLNRSGLIVARALILGGMEPPDAIALLRDKRSPAVLCNDAFEEWLVS